jgi:hypothetical protein
MKLHNIIESYESLPEGDQFGLICNVCGGKTSMLCECSFYGCLNDACPDCVGFGLLDSGWVETAEGWFLDLDEYCYSGLGVYCPEHNPKNGGSSAIFRLAKESYEGLPEGDEFFSYLSCDGCGRDTDAYLRSDFYICGGPSKRDPRFPCGYVWCYSCVFRGDGWKTSGRHIFDIIKCPACSPGGISDWKTMNPGRLDESYEGLPEGDEFSNHPILNFLNANQVLMKPEPREPGMFRLITNMGRGHDVTSLVMAHEDFKGFYGSYIVTKDWSRANQVHPGEWVLI